MKMMDSNLFKTSLLNNIANIIGGATKELILKLAKLLFIAILFSASSVFAAKKVNLSLTNYNNEFNIEISPVERGLSYNYKIINDYLIISFNQQISYSIKNSSNSAAYSTYNFASYDKKTIYIKLKFKTGNIRKILQGKTNIIKLKILDEKPVNKNPIKEEKPASYKVSLTAEKIEDTNLNLQQIEILNSDSDVLTLGFVWDHQVACAAFSEGQYSWIIFNKKKEFDASLLRTLGIFEQIKIFAKDDHTVIRFKHSLSGELKVEQQDYKWNITFIRDPKIKILPASLINEVSSLKTIGRVFDARKAGEAINFIEEITGEALIFVPSQQADIGIAISRNFVDYVLLKTAQGMVIRKINEEVKVKTGEEGVEISSPNYAANINLQDRINQKTREILKKQAQDSTIRGITKYTMLPFFEKGVTSDSSYMKEYNKLISELAASDSTNLSERRYELAKFFFLHEMYTEAVTILKVISDASPRFMLQRPEVKFLHAVSLTLSSRYEEAEKNYRALLQNIQDKKNINEIKMWLNLNNFYQYNTNNYVGLLDYEDNLIFTYSDTLYWRIALTDLEIALKNNNIDVTERIFSGLRDFKKEDIRLLNNIKYLRAKYYVNKQEYQKAKQYLNVLKLDNRDPYNQVRAQVELVKMQLTIKEIDSLKAIATLNSIKHNWRGDFVEYDLLMLLAKLYRESAQPIYALRTYKYIIESSPLKTDQLFITAEMIGLFNKIFSPGGASETMSDFDTVSLFYEFKELTPIGSAGENIVLQIATRLVNLDLLETAEALLSHQVEFRLIGEKRVNVGDQLAYIYLINRKPELAIKVLDETDKDNFAYNEHLKRIRLKAKAYIDIQNYNYALQLLKEDKSVAAELLKEEIYFKMQAWDKVIKLLEPEIFDKLSKGEEYFDTDKLSLIRLLISYLMVSDRHKINLLKERLKTSNIEIKNLLEFFGNQTKTVNYKDLEDSLGIKNIELFLDEIKKDIFNTPHKTINNKPSN
jgi:hypothetical protein